GPGDLSTTIEAYAALRLVGDPADAAHLQKALEFIRDSGGLANARVFTRLWLALFGQWDWSDLPALPPELILLPPMLPLNVYDFACWARQAVVAVTVVGPSRPVHPWPDGGLPELHAGAATRPASGADDDPVARFLIRLDRVLRLYGRHPIGPLR